jgi:hypothetical protein
MLVSAIVAFLAGAIVFAIDVDGDVPLATDPSAGGIAGAPTDPPTPPLESAANPRARSNSAAYEDGSFACPFRPESMLSDTWLANACEYRAEVGLTIEYACSPGGISHEVTGSRWYTDDSSVCTAGVHAGVISADEGGKVSVVIRAGRAGYLGSNRHGVDSASRGPWPGTFEVLLRPSDR